MKPEIEDKLRLILRLKAQSTVHPALGCCGSSHGIYHAYNLVSVVPILPFANFSESQPLGLGQHHGPKKDDEEQKS